MHPANLLTWKIKQRPHSVPLKTLRYMAAFVIIVGQGLNWDMFIYQWFQRKSSSVCDDSFNSILACVYGFSFYILLPCVCVCACMWVIYELRKDWESPVDSCWLPFTPERTHVLMRINVLWHPMGLWQPQEGLMKKYNLAKRHGAYQRAP